MNIILQKYLPFYVAIIDDEQQNLIMEFKFD